MLTLPLDPVTLTWIIFDTQTLIKCSRVNFTLFNALFSLLYYFCNKMLTLPPGSATLTCSIFDTQILIKYSRVNFTLFNAQFSFFKIRKKILNPKRFSPLTSNHLGSRQKTAKTSAKLVCEIGTKLKGLNCWKVWNFKRF